MKKILFVCHGNICRSPMAEFYFRRLVENANLQDEFEVASAGVNKADEGSPVYPMAKRQLAGRGIGCKGKVSQMITPSMYRNFDYILAMDDLTIRQIEKLLGPDKENKITRLLDHVSIDKKQYTHRDVLDPWYTRKFDVAWEDIRVGCGDLFLQLTKGMSNNIAKQDE